MGHHVKVETSKRIRCPVGQLPSAMPQNVCNSSMPGRSREKLGWKVFEHHRCTHWCRSSSQHILALCILALERSVGQESFVL